jgi:hypothetical protein
MKDMRRGMSIDCGSNPHLAKTGVRKVKGSSRFDLLRTRSPTAALANLIAPEPGTARNPHRGSSPTKANEGVRCEAHQNSIDDLRAELIDATGNLTVKTDAVRQALEFYKKLIAFLPPDVGAWDDASNNKWLLSGSGAMIMNPPSAWAVAKRDASRVADQCWTHGFPAGRRADFRPICPSSGPSGPSRRTRQRPRACLHTCQGRHQLRSWSSLAAAMACRRTKS